MNHNSRQKSFYDKVAKNYGASEASSMRDPFIRQSENEFIIHHIKDWIKRWEYSPKILDLGCGNGSTLHRLESEFSSQATYQGIDANKSLIDIAKSRKNNSLYVHQDMRDWKPREKFQIVITQRSLINLASNQEQYDMIQILDEILVEGGRLILIESFEEGFLNLNKTRKQMNLPPVEISPQNVYLKEKFVLKLKERGLFETQVNKQDQHRNLSQHFFATRVIHPLLKEVSGSRIETHFVKIMREMEAYQSPQMILTPIQQRVFEKKF